MKASSKLLIGLLLGPMIVMAAPLTNTPTPASDDLVYVASYTPQGTGGIYAFRFDPLTEEMSAPELAAPLDNLAGIALTANGHFLYAVTRHDDRAGDLHVFRIDKSTGHLVEMNSTPSGVKGPVPHLDRRHGDLDCRGCLRGRRDSNPAHQYRRFSR